MLCQCWASVVDGGPTLTQHWVNVSCWAVMMNKIPFLPEKIEDTQSGGLFFRDPEKKIVDRLFLRRSRRHLSAYQ